MSEQPPFERIATREVPVSIPSPDSERRMEIRRADWDRLKRRLSRLSHPIPKLHLVYSVLLGIASTASLSIIPLSKSQGLPVWVIPLYWCVTIFAFICAIVFIFIDRKVQSATSSGASDIEEDMEEIEKAFPK